jgi:hypothetical protein
MCWAGDMLTPNPPGSFVLAFSVRAGINVLLVLLLRRRKMRLAMLRHAIFGAEPFRFGAMIGESHRSCPVVLYLVGVRTAEIS